VLDGVDGAEELAVIVEPSPRPGGMRRLRCSVVTVSLLFDLDGTLIDSVYQHVLAWRDALDEEGMELAAWVIHRKIGMSGGLAARSLVRESGRPIDAALAERLRQGHAAAFTRYDHAVRPLPGAVELLRYLEERGVPWAIATSGLMETARAGLASLGVDPERHVVITRDLGADPLEAVVVGDSVWDLLAAQRGRFIGVGLLSGGYGRAELVGAGAYRVYDDPGDLLAHLDEVGARSSD
jgi:phosphoglycolate phosphatase-like HAD superfamily hydrolase